MSGTDVVAKDPDKVIEPVHFQPVKSPGNYEAEFAIKDGDVIFHFWPYGFHEAQVREQTPPRFKRGFHQFLVSAMASAFDSRRLEFEDDKDMGAIFVRAKGFADNQFYRQLAIQACEKLHAILES